MIRVLIVDDREESRYFLNTLLKSNGYEVESACHGEEALDKARQNPPQLIISDLLMPRMDGYTLLRQCRADTRLKQIPFVVYTATYTDPKDRQLALNLGANDFIIKPAEPVDFIARISQVVTTDASGGTNAIPIPALAAPVRIPIAIPEEDEKRNLRLYSKVLIHKLEDKMEELDKANRNLQRDIAERKQMQEQLRESERKARAIFDLSFGFVGLLNPDGTLVEANRSALDFAGIQLPDVVGKPFWETPWWTHSTEAQQQIRAAVRTAAGGELVRFETTFLATDGAPHTFDISVKPLKDEAGRVVLLIPEGRDITKRKRAEEAHTRLATAVEQAAEAIVITDTSGKILYVNPAFEKITGFTVQEAVGQNTRILKSGKYDSAFYRQMWDSLTQGKVWSGRITNKKKNGALYEEEMTISPICDSAGRVINYVAVKHDVTQEVALEEQLRQIQKMESVGQLAGGVAHDFNNILTVIQGNASLLLEAKNLSEADADQAKQIINAAERAAGLTRQLLLFGRKQAMQPAHLNLNQVVGNMTKMLQRILGEDIALRSDYSPVLPLVFADAGMIEQVLLNLAVNARDAMSVGGQLVIATASKTIGQECTQQNPAAAPGQYVCLSVSDTGCGIAPGNLSHIFEPFFTTKEIGKGTGLGLATVYAIVKQHRGWIEVDSQVGKGTTFCIHLPVAREISAKQNTTAVIPELPRGNEVILVVEDEQAVRLLVGNLLQRCGYAVLSAVSGIDALNLWKQRKDGIQLLLTDMVLPDGMMGRELAEKLKGEKPQLKVIYTSGYSASVVGKGPSLVEGVNFLQKPYHPQNLAQTVRDCLDRPAAGV
ncbi:MAG: response regulator [Verrucomicrobiia bacterium]